MTITARKWKDCSSVLLFFYLFSKIVLTKETETCIIIQVAARYGSHAELLERKPVGPDASG